jgi:hypothetical protein
VSVGRLRGGVCVRVGWWSGLKGVPCHRCHSHTDECTKPLTLNPKPFTCPTSRFDEHPRATGRSAASSASGSSSRSTATSLSRSRPTTLGESVRVHVCVCVRACACVCVCVCACACGLCTGSSSLNTATSTLGWWIQTGRRVCVCVGLSVKFQLKPQHGDVFVAGAAHHAACIVRVWSMLQSVGRL